MQAVLAMYPILNLLLLMLQMLIHENYADFIADYVIHPDKTIIAGNVIPRDDRRTYYKRC